MVYFEPPVLQKWGYDLSDLGTAMQKKTRKRRGNFLDKFRLADTYLLKPNPANGRPGLIAGFDDTGDPVLIKIWTRRADVSDDDLQEIWHHEVRNLLRIGGYPGAADSIVPLHQAAHDVGGYYLVLKPGQRRPLSSILKYANPGHWLVNQRQPANRAKLWRNLKNIAVGLGILHAQGLLHRNIDHWSVLATGGDEPDFQLTGFEWSLRLVSAAAGKKKARKTEDRIVGPASFLEDWKGFGVLAAGLVGANERRIQDPSIPASSVSENLTVEEVRLLRNLIQSEPIDRLDDEIVEARIDSVLLRLDAEIAGKDPKLFLVVRVGTSTPLSGQIRQEFGNDVETSAIDEQLTIIRDDLSENPLLLAVRSNVGDIRLLLRGKRLIYNLNPYIHPRPGSLPTWELAYSDGTKKNDPATINLVGKEALPSSSIEVLTAGDAADRFGRIRGKQMSWAALRAKFESELKRQTPEKKFHKALALTQFLEALFAAADAYPVEIVKIEPAQHEDMLHITIQLRDDAERDALSTSLGLKKPAARFDEILREGRRADEWTLSEARFVGDRPITDTLWRFIKKSDQKNGLLHYVFSGPNAPSQLSNPIFIPGDSVGRDVQFRRRLKALRALAEHVELLRMLVDPRMRILESHEEVERDEAFEELDLSKQTAFTAIVSTLPLFLVQGPPGVGKTRLVSDLVRATFKDDTTNRLLLTAQSNAAVDHLLQELNKSFQSDTDDALIVRCRPRDRNEEPGPYEVSLLAQNLLHRLSASDLVATAPEELKQAAQRLANSGGQTTGGGSAQVSQNNARRAFEGLLVRAANVVFATTNSSELERLIEERSQFDWAIVEEAGKATGGELLSAMLLSHRRLMIGDHKQLSPFNSERMIQLLKDADAVRGALKVGQEFIGRALRDPSTEEVLDELDEQELDFPALCSQAIDCVLLFEWLIEAEFRLQAKNNKARPIAHRLTQQHRMHPSIAKIVSKAFYEGVLESHPKTIERFKKEECPIISTNKNKLPNLPVVVVDMPYLQKTVGMKEAEHQPRWHNPQELEAIQKVLRNISAAPGVTKKPTLAILSPYGEQVRRLKIAIDENVSSFPSLSGFCPAVSATSYCGTVDSFQGNEADVVLVSLVRNNHHTGVRSALGFLSDSRRMNVLFSRARWRMVLVGSLDFLDAILDSTRNTDTGADIAFLKIFLDAIRSEEKNKSAKIIPWPEFISEVGK